MSDTAKNDAGLRERVAGLRTDVRRAVLRRRRLLSALCAAGAVLAGLEAVAPAPPETVRVLAAARDLPSGTVLAGGDLVALDLPAGTAPDGAAARSEAVGRTLAAPVRRGEPVTDVRLVSGGLLAGYPGTVAVPLRIPDAGAVALLAVGDRIDVVASDASGGGGTTVASRVPVIAIPHADRSASGPAGDLAGRLVVVAAAPEEAEMLATRSVSRYLSVTISR